MKIVHSVKEARETVKDWKKQGYSVGFVPTMGYLHEGHLSLIEKSVSENNKTVVSIFLNPMQFAPTEDLAAYPRDFDADTALCEKTGADLIFNPVNEEMYDRDFCTFVDMTGVTGTSGKSRPTHFRGVCTVVNKLFNIIAPDRAYFGRKDAQQLAVITRMVRDLDMDVEIVGCPLIREADGLAKSSRNTYLSTEERQAALILSKAVFEAERLVNAGERSSENLIAVMRGIIQSEPLARIDYIEVVDSFSIEKKDIIQGSVLVAIAVFIGLKGKIHRATVTQAELDYVGSITIDADLLDAAGIYEYEKVQIADVNNGNRFETYTISGERGTGVVCLNGAAARCVQAGDKIIIMAYAQMTVEELKENPPKEDCPSEVKHITLAQNADLLLIAPADANVIGKLACGIADDMLTSFVLAVKDIPKFIAPAMNTRMYENSIVRENIDKLKRHGFEEIEPKESLLACGDIGKGALADVGDIIAAVERVLS
ncbi:cytidylate kinase/pantoate-beta-alanine ligase [Holotrichia oblita]|nr:cytidylate kinase/pantoate-beta-alanine ligase [Holotrichia oblita]